jgi:hypothetical protein
MKSSILILLLSLIKDADKIGKCLVLCRSCMHLFRKNVFFERLYFQTITPLYIDLSFTNRKTYNFHFILSGLFGIRNPDIEKKVKKDGEDMKTKNKEIANMLLSSDDDFIKTLEGKPLIINGVTFYFDCDNIY